MQLVNSDAKVGIRIWLDRKMVYEGQAEATSSANPLITVVGAFPLRIGARHTLIAETVDSATKSQVEWTAAPTGPVWAVISYNKGRANPFEPAFFGIGLQGQPFQMK